MTVTAEITPRDRRRVRTMRELSRAAVTLFAEQGFESTTVAQIAEAADFSGSTFFRLFPAKEDSVFWDLETRLHVAADSVADATADGTWAALTASLLGHARSWEEPDPAFAAARARLFHTEPALIARYLAHCDRWEAGLRASMQARQAPTSDGIAESLTAGIVVSAYRTAFRLQVERGGSLVDHLRTTLDHVEQRSLVPNLLAPTS